MSITDEQKRKAIADAKNVIAEACDCGRKECTRLRNVCNVAVALDLELADVRADLKSCIAELEGVEDSEIRQDTRALLARIHQLRRDREVAADAVKILNLITHNLMRDIVILRRRCEATESKLDEARKGFAS